MIFYEELGLLDLVVSIASRRKAFYLKKTLLARLGEAVFARINNRRIPLSKLEIGHLDCATHLRRGAYEAAGNSLARLNIDTWAQRVSRRLGINFSLLVSKYFFEEIYAKYEFIAFATRYAEEHPDELHLIKLSPQFAGAHQRQLGSNAQISIRQTAESLRFLMGLIVIPLLLTFHWTKSGTKATLRFQRALVCLIDGDETLEMFEALCPRHGDIHYVIEAANAKYLSRQPTSERGISVLGLTGERMDFFRKFCVAYILIALKEFKTISPFGFHPFRIFHILLQGASMTPHGEGNTFLTFEHLTLPRAVRNEFMKSQGCRSVFVTKNTYVTYQCFAAERQINYDVVCCSGQHMEDAYRRRSAMTEVFLPTGSYDSHAVSGMPESRRGNMEALKSKIGDTTVIVILATGICDATYSNEERLMKFAVALSQVPNARIVVRLKPVEPPAQYADFYHDILAAGKDIIVTGREFELLELTSLADLFVTAISTSACDLAVRGGKVFFVDFMKTPDLYLPWEKFPDMVLSEDTAFKYIESWVLDSENGPIRSRHAEVMKDLRDFLAYRFDGFGEYKRNLLENLGLLYEA
jgi:hypothetical protein